jgi:hypothetical protein
MRSQAAGRTLLVCSEGIGPLSLRMGKEAVDQTKPLHDCIATRGHLASSMLISYADDSNGLIMQTGPLRRANRPK